MTSAVAPMHCEPRIASQMVSQQLSGHAVSIVDVDTEWVRARGADGYDGWIHLGFLARENGSPAAPRALSLGCIIERSGREPAALPLRALITEEHQLADGNALPVDEVRAQFPLHPEAIVESARRFFHGTSYLWGGVTPWGADCSGLAQSVFALHGYQLPRDAWQQAELGELVDGGIDGTVVGDLLFFSDRADRHVTHVGIALGERGMLHLALGRGGYAVERLDGRGDAYSLRLRERFLHARRYL